MKSLAARPIRILHFADVHFGMENYGKIDPMTGLNTRLLDFQQAFQKIVDYATGKIPKSKFQIPNKFQNPINQDSKQNTPVDLVLFAGDAYKTREPTPTHQRLFAEGIHQIASAGIPVVMIVGNHDLPGALGKSHTLDVFQTLHVPNVQIVDQPKFITIPITRNQQPIINIQIACLPWLTRSQFLTTEETKRMTHEKLNHYITDKIRALITDFDKKLDFTQPTILMAHGTVEGALFGSERIVELGTDIIIPLDAIKKSHFQYVALGHIHQHQVILDDPMVVYAGSIERIDFGEAKEDKGFMVVDFVRHDNKWRLDHQKTHLVSTGARRFETVLVTINENDPDPTETIIQAIHRLNVADAVIKLIIRCSEFKAGAIREGPIREALHDTSFVAAITKQINDRGRVILEQGYSDELISLQPIDLLEKFLHNRQKSTAKIDHLKKYAQILLQELGG